MKIHFYQNKILAAVYPLLLIIFSTGICHAQCNYTFSPSEINIPYNGGFFIVNYETNCSGTAPMDIEVIVGPEIWLQVEVDYTNKALVLTADPSNSGITRSGLINITIDYGGSQDTYTLAVSQECNVGSPDIIGKATACGNDIETYSVPSHYDFDAYSWNAIGAVILSGADTRTVTVQFRPGPGYAVINLEAQSSGCHVSPSSRTIPISDAGPIAINSNPVAKTVNEDQTATFSVNATNATLYQWQVSGDNGTFSNIWGATSSSYSVTANAVNNGKYYRCIAKNDCNVLTSTSAKLTVKLLTLSSHPSSLNVYENQPTSFSVSASNVTGYQWQVSSNNSSFSNITGATSRTYSFTASADKNGKYYRCRITNGYKTIYSNSARVTTKLLSITSHPSTKHVYENQPTSFSVSASNATGYQWQVSSDNSSFSNITGGTSRTYSFTASAGKNGKYYRCRVTNGYKTIYSNSAKLTIKLLSITSHPSAKHVYENQPTSFSVSASNATGYQWQVSSDNSSFSNITGGTSRTYSFTASADKNGKYYRCRVTNGYKTIYSSSAKLTIKLLSIGSHPSDIEVYDTHTAMFSIVANNAASYQWQVSSDNTTFSNISGGTSSSYSLTGTSANDGNYYRCVVSNGYKSISSNSAKLTVTFSSLYGEEYVLSPSNKNYILTVTPKKASTELGVSTFIGGKRRSLEITDQINYYDGLGRPEQNVIVNASPTGADIVQPVIYDDYGREARKYLPYTINESNGQFRGNCLVEQQNFYNRQFTGYDDNPPAFSQTIFDNSPLNRVVQQGFAGSVWQPLDTDHPEYKGRTQKFEYRTNLSAEAIYFWEYLNVDANWNSAAGFNRQTYSPGELYVTQVVDENNNVSKEYKDKLGRVILKRTFNGAEELNTYYVYDYRGLLRCVIPPKAEANIVGQENLCFFYHYDSRRRMIKKQIPGAAPVYMIYDRRDRLVMTQDGNQRNHKDNTGNSAPQWLFTKYDEFNRPVITGLYTSTESMSNLQDIVDNNGIYFETPDASGTKGYTNNMFPTTATEYLTVTWYDDYSFGIPSELAFDPSKRIDDYNDDDGIANGYSDRVKGMVTGSSEKVLNTNTWLTTTNYYDDQYRIIQSIKNNYPDGKIIASNQYNFTGTLKRTRTTNIMDGKEEEVEKNFTYDHMERLLSIDQQIKNDPREVEISRMEYNELEQVTDKLTGGVNTRYDYNIRGWLTGIESTGTDVLFSMDLLYENKLSLSLVDPELHSNISEQYNGNISAMLWYTKGNTWQTYAFQYDANNRLTGSDYSAVADGWFEQIGFMPYGFAFMTTGRDESTIDAFEEKAISYDLNGNITNLLRTAQNGAVRNDFAYTYTGNQLQSINSVNHYEYDQNGNMIQDGLKNFAVSYNSLNLPSVVSKGNDEIGYVYAAGGEKLAKVKNDTVQHYYSGNFIYDDRKVIDYILHEEGRVTKTGDGYQYEYFIKDHLGNTRVLFTDQAQTTVFAATMEAASAGYEEKRFSNIEDTRQLDKLFNHTEAGNHSALLNAAKGKIVGPATALKVMPGDTIKMKTFAKYLEKPKNIKEMTTHLGTAVAGAFGYVPGREQTRAIKEFFDGVLGATGLITPSDNEGVPKAYINYLFFDKNMALKSHGFRQITEAARGNHEELMLEVGVQEEGYMYIYTANETNADVDVYFDDVEIMQVHSEMLAVYDYYPFGLTFDDPVQQVAQPKNFYLYNGKEFQELTDWYDYGARMYDAALGRFFTQDRFAEKYYMLSPYQYAANNPINNIDVNGDWIYVMHEGQHYKYDNGKLYTYDKEKSEYVDYIPEEDSFLSGVLQGLNDLSSKTDQGKKLVGFFANEDNNAFIEMGEVGSGNSEGYGDITVDPSLKGSEIPTEKGIQESPFWLDLGHELAHTQDYLTNGESVYDVWVENPDDPKDPIEQSEKYATHVENIMRAQAGMPLRTHYATQGNGGYEPTRILNANGGSIFYNVSIDFQGKELKSNVPQIYRILYKKK